MRTSHALALAILLLLAAVAPPVHVRAEDAPVVTGTYEVVDGVRTLRLWGTPRERGFAQGYLLASEIVRGTDQGLGDFLEGNQTLYTSKILPLATAGFLWSEAEKAELDGVLAGIQARLPAAERRVECLGRDISLGDLQVLNTFGDWYALGCSSVAVWGAHTADGSPSVVRNFDFMALDLVLTMQHVRVVAKGGDGGDGRGWVGLSHPGSIGTMTAMNDAGVFVAIHDVRVLPEMKDIFQGNVPRLLALRRLMERLAPEGAVEKAVELCREWNTLFGNNFIVATPASGDGAPAGVLEYDTREGDDQGVDLREPTASVEGDTPPSYVVCSNHHRIRADGRCDRYDRLLGACNARIPDDGPLGVEEMFSIGNRAAAPAAGLSVTEAGWGTLHQVVGLTGIRQLWIKFAPADGSVRNAKAHRLDVGALLDGQGEPAPE